MAYRKVEQLVEDALYDRLSTVLDSGTTLRRRWTADSGNGVIEPKTFPLCLISARPNIPAGHRTTERDLEVNIEMVTYADDDPAWETVCAMYHTVREELDTYAFTATGLRSFDVTVVDGDVQQGDKVNHIYLGLAAKVCVNP